VAGGGRKEVEGNKKWVHLTVGAPT